MVSIMPSAVSGFTKQEAPSAGVVPCGKTRHWLALMQRNCAYIAPPRIATVFPISACAWSAEPVRTTTPAPSLPTGNDWSMRPIMDFIMGGGMLAVTIGLSRVPETFAVDMSAPPNISPKSEGLMGDASTRTTTSSGFGSGIGTLVSESSRMPSFLTVDRNWSPVDCCSMRSPLISLNPSSASTPITGATAGGSRARHPSDADPISLSCRRGPFGNGEVVEQHAEGLRLHRLQVGYQEMIPQGAFLLVTAGSSRPPGSPTTSRSIAADTPSPPSTLRLTRRG